MLACNLGNQAAQFPNRAHRSSQQRQLFCKGSEGELVEQAVLHARVHTQMASFMVTLLSELFQASTRNQIWCSQTRRCDARLPMTLYSYLHCTPCYQHSSC